MRSLVPPGVVVVESHGDLPGEPRPEEAPAVARAVEGRRREFVTARECARHALVLLGERPVAIPRGPHREPVWPAGVVGSLTHCPGYRAAALARRDVALAVGIDAEPHEPLPEEALAARLFDAEERRHLAALDHDLPLAWERIAFSAKESVYKAWFPLTGERLGFDDARLRIGPGGTFTATLSPGAVLEGRWTVRDGLIRTAVVLRDRPPGR